MAGEVHNIVTMALWFTSKKVYCGWVMALFHLTIILTMLGKNVIMIYILISQKEVDCRVFDNHHIGLVLAKCLAIVFMSVKLLANIPHHLMLKRSLEYSDKPKSTFCTKPIFGIYLYWQVITDLFITGLANTLALI